MKPSGSAKHKKPQQPTESCVCCGVAPIWPVMMPLLEDRRRWEVVKPARRWNTISSLTGLARMEQIGKLLQNPKVLAYVMLQPDYTTQGYHARHFVVLDLGEDFRLVAFYDYASCGYCKKYWEESCDDAERRRLLLPLPWAEPVRKKTFIKEVLLQKLRGEMVLSLREWLVELLS